MNIISWNCYNLNYAVKNGERKNRVDYLQYLCKQMPSWDVVFLMEVESAFDNTVLGKTSSFHFFFPCTELDHAWTPMTSGIFLCTAKHITVLKHEVLFPGKDIPAENGRGMESEYGFALRTLLKDSRNGEIVDLVTVWNTRRKTTPTHDYSTMLALLLKKLNSDGFFDSGIPAAMIGDYNRSAAEIEALLPAGKNLTVYVRESTHFSNRDSDSHDQSSNPDHAIGRTGSLHFLQPDGLPADSFGKSIGYISRHNFVNKDMSDHLPLFMQIGNN